MQHDIIFHRTLGFQYSIGPRTMAKCFWSTPKDLSTSFLVESCIIAKWDLLGLEDMGLSSQCGTWRIDIICKVVTHNVLMAIDNIDSRRSIFGNKPCEQWWYWHHIQLIVRAMEFKEWMSNPYILWFNGFQNDCWIFAMALYDLSNLQDNSTMSGAYNLMIRASRPSMLYTLTQESLCVFITGCPQVL
jgi:hypothetical protein